MTVTPPATVTQPRAADTAMAATVKALLSAGHAAQARDQFGDLVALHQSRGTRIAYHYLRDAAEADEAVQDAFVKAFVHLSLFRDDLSFEVWFTRILVNGCLDRLKARARRNRWIVPQSGLAGGQDVAARQASTEPSPEAMLLRRERQVRVLAAIDRLPQRQRTVVLLMQIEGYNTSEVSAITRLRESTIRVHLFRALRALRKLLSRERPVPPERINTEVRT